MYFRLILLVTASLVFTISDAQRYQELQADPDVTFDEIVQEANAYFDNVGRGRGSGYKQFKRWEYIAQRSLKPDGTIMTPLERRQEMAAFQAAELANPDFSNPWTEQGPLSAINTSTWSSHIGRVSAVDIDPNDINHLLIGAPTGGVWKSTDMGGNWTPLFDNADIINIWSTLISYDDPDHYLIGTQGLGIMKSIDGGATWSMTSGIPANDKIITLERAPDDKDVVLAAHEFGAIYRSADGGDTWTSVLAPGVRIYDIEFKPGQPDIVYAGARGRMYMSIDKGLTWSIVSGPWSPSFSLMLGVTPHDSEYIYVLQHAGSGGFGALYLSTDAGLTWKQQSNNNLGNNNIMGYELNQLGGQAPRDMDVVVSPTDKTEVHVAGISTFRSNNEGVTWTRTSQWTTGNPFGFVHADVDLMIYYGNTIFIGTDGGLFYTQDQAENFTDITTGLGVRQFYRIGVAQSASGIMVSGGSQDNGTGLIKNGQWYDWMGADGMESFISYADSNYVWGMIQNGNPRVSFDGGITIGLSPSIPGGSGNWVTPVEQDPNDPSTVYVGKSEIYKNTNGGAGSWQTISSFGSVNADELKISPANSSIMYAAFDNRLYKTLNGGEGWTEVDLGQFSSFINYIAMHSTDTERLALGLSGSAVPFIESTDGGTNWSDISLNLPTLPGNCITYDRRPENGIYVGMTPGIYYKNDGDTEWHSYFAGLPNVIVNELEIHHASETLLAGTYGRGLWSNKTIGPSTTDVALIGVSGVGDDNCGSVVADLGVDVKSLGTGDTPPFSVDLYINGDFIASRPFGQSLVTNQEATLSFGEIAFNEGVQEIRFVLQLIGDEDLSNNEVTKMSTIQFGNLGTVEVTLDDAPTETSWTLKDASDVIQYSGGSYTSGQANTTITEEVCLTEQCYTFDILDSGANGLNSPGTYSLYLNADMGNPLVEMTNASFGASATHPFCAPVVVIPPPCPYVETVTGTINSNTTIIGNTIEADAVITDGTVDFKANGQTILMAPFESNPPSILNISREACRVQPSP